MKFINLIAGPSATKSTGAALLFGMLKTAGYEVELVTEFAKAMTWQNNEVALRNALYMFAKQEMRLEVLRDKPLEFVIVDGCILNALVYPVPRMFKTFEPLVIEMFRSYDNMNFFIDRVKPYSPVGRNEKEDQARETCKRLEDLMAKHDIPCIKKLPGDEFAPGEIFTMLTGKTPPFVPQEMQDVVLQ